ncbi:MULTISPECIES: SDR family NAD(P)-dependent oxidoreductase [Streptomyces]|uniref:Glucose 1-dehydrogenase 2 n=1 Tax=Streptomyces chartreusis NRRL 3882 TaxID=1079985 RepID=A0A2N9B3A1_STRCX|nr:MULTISPECIES: oxidoreductase [Streptomyces]MYS89699.1 SDR family oxidoreductase [Streptomyces sp. SID5464]SOR77824.1 Glucose 1-dehydrogenase 2 [Streptomyces chartreusis NRRL 3882]
MTSAEGLSGKVAVVTGAGRGIGRAVCEEFLLAGACVVAGSRTAGADLADLPVADADRLYAVDVDLATPDGPGRLVGTAEHRFGRADILVNNVGGFPGGEPRFGGFRSVSDDDWMHTVEFNLLTTVRAVRAVLPLMLEHSGGSIVNVSSVNARLPAPNVVDYAAAKAALNSLSKSLSAEFAAEGIRVNTVSPGPVRTPLWTAPGGLAEQAAEAMELTDGEAAMKAMADGIGGIPLGRFAEPGEVARLVRFLAGPAAAYITGSEVVIDGGLLRTV